MSGENSSEMDIDEGSEEEEFKALEKEAKMLRDESVSESGDDEEAKGDQDAEFLAAGEDLDLPEEDSDQDDEADEDDQTDDDLEDYYNELGIAGETDTLKKEEPVYKKTQK
jgi:hypothetical protein